MGQAIVETAWAGTGTAIEVRSDERPHAAEVVEGPLYDPERLRSRA